jgi:hypothetical protein
MTTKKSFHLFWGIILILLGAWFALIVARTTFNIIRHPSGFSNPWLAGELPLLIAWSIFSVWVGNREFQRSTGQDVRKPRFRWGRMLAGASLVFRSLESHISPSPNAFKADNDAQAAGMLIATILMVLIGLLLIAFSFKSAESQPQIESILKSNSAQGET